MTYDKYKYRPYKPRESRSDYNYPPDPGAEHYSPSQSKRRSSGSDAGIGDRYRRSTGISRTRARAGEYAGARQSQRGARRDNQSRQPQEIATDKWRYEQYPLDREDIISPEEVNVNGEYDYWDYPTIDYGAGEYEPEDEYSRYYDPSPSGSSSQSASPGHVHQPGQRPEHRYDHERWSRGRYGIGSGLPDYWEDRDGNYDRSIEAQYPQQGQRYLDEDVDSGNWPYYFPEEIYVEAPDFYRERYMPREDSLKRLYLRMFRNIEYNIKVPFIQLIATGALFFIFIVNYYINIEYVEALGKFSPWVAVQPPAVAAILGAVFGIFIYLFPNMDKDIKRTVIVVTIILLIVLFTIPALIAWGSTSELEEVGKAFASSIFEFLKLSAVLVYWAPMFLGIYGIWSKNSFYIGASAMFLFLIIIVLDIYLFYEGLGITKIRENWIQYVIFSVVLFFYMELSDSAITFAKFTSVKDKEAIDPGYYEHLDKIIQKYFVYFILFTVFILILSYITLNFNVLLRAFGSEQVAESLELGYTFGHIIALIVIFIVIILIGLFIRHERAFKKTFGKLSDVILGPKPKQRYYGRGRYNRRSRTY